MKRSTIVAGAAVLAIALPLVAQATPGHDTDVPAPVSQEADRPADRHADHDQLMDQYMGTDHDQLMDQYMGADHDQLMDECLDGATMGNGMGGAMMGRSMMDRTDGPGPGTMMGR